MGRSCYCALWIEEERTQSKYISSSVSHFCMTSSLMTYRNESWEIIQGMEGEQLIFADDGRYSELR